MNDVEADRAAGIWVDASGTVSCAFTKTFDEVGTYKLTVTASNVNPGDWDTANNTVDGSIEIVSPIVNAPLSWSAHARNWSRSTTGRRNGWYRQSSWYGGYHSDWDYGWDQYQRHEYFQFNGASTTFATFPVTVTFSGTADDASFANFSRTLEPDVSSSSSTFSHARYHGFDAATGHFVYVDTYGYADGNARTNLQVRRFAGDVVYHSWGYSRTWYDYYGSYYYYDRNSTSAYHEGSFWPMTSTASFEYSMSDSNNTVWSASGGMTLTPYTYAYNNPLYCYSWSSWYWYDEYGYQCYEDSYQEQGYSGFTSGSNL